MKKEEETNKNTKMINKILILFIIVILSSNIVEGKQGHITLLTVIEEGNKTKGGTADLYLEIRPGTGRIYLDSLPLTKIDTQISTRLAKEVACSFTEKDCSKKDFLYTIRANSPIVGGPSAGAAITMLTISELNKEKIDSKTTITGTINAGGIIGPVAGIKEKALAAKEKGYTRVIVPSRGIIENEEELINETNATVTYAENLIIEGIEIIPVSTLEEAYYEFTGNRIKNYSYEIEIPEDYQKIMKSVAEELCTRYEEILLDTPENLIEENLEIYNETQESINKSRIALDNKDYYSAASFCFSANIGIRTTQFKGLTNETLINIANMTKDNANKMMQDINDRELKTMADLETTIIVKERIIETLNILEENQTEILSQLPYIVERYNSAIVWSKFFSYPSNEVELNKQHLTTACLSKISEAEERLSYVDLLFGASVAKTEELSEAKKSYENGDYTYCLFKASKITADVNAVLISLSVTKEKAPELVTDLLNQARAQINKQNNFPVLGYSYYNYANTLKEDKPELAIVFAGYSSEFSNLDIYFPKKRKAQLDLREDILLTFLIGFTLGAILTAKVYIKHNKKEHNQKNKIKQIRKK